MLMIAKSWKTKTYSILIALLISFIALINAPTISAVVLSQGQKTTVGATYYGGHYDGSLGSWVIDNKNQCDRIKAGEFSAASLGAVVTESCSDDNGLGYLNDIPLHNQVSFAELSNNPSSPDYAALGNLAAGTKILIEYNGRCVVAEKRDIGQGGSSVNGHQRAIDFWWQTARSLGFTNGFDTVNITLVSQDTPLTPLNQTTSCSTAAVTQATTATPPSTTTPEPTKTSARPETTTLPVSESAPKENTTKKVAETTGEPLSVEQTPQQEVTVTAPVLAEVTKQQSQQYSTVSRPHNPSRIQLYVYLLAFSVGPTAFALILTMPRLKRVFISH